MTGWFWWAGLDEDVDCEGIYQWGEFKTRDEAVSAGMRETQPGQSFYVIEARSSESIEHEGADMVPFLRRRNQELVNHTAAAAQ
jgi:hypothetical protein